MFAGRPFCTINDYRLSKGFLHSEREVTKNITKYVYNEVDVIVLIGGVGMRNVAKIWATVCLDLCYSLNPKKYVKRGKNLQRAEKQLVAKN